MGQSQPINTEDTLARRIRTLSPETQEHLSAIIESLAAAAAATLERDHLRDLEHRRKKHNA